ncbi:homeobox protein cut-like 1 [Mus caroli]|uniref:Homeobox protein cut-like 1 n=1 Tax=Mus caroli TaxID=10089 RepID=A0A6P7RAV7_MUSCR|nr:homeobox protein cut-like 1 [Mus caroli]
MATILNSKGLERVRRRQKVLRDRTSGVGRDRSVARLCEAPRSSRGHGTHARGGPFPGRALTNSAAGAAKAPNHHRNREPPRRCVRLERPEGQARAHPSLAGQRRWPPTSRGAKEPTRKRNPGETPGTRRRGLSPPGVPSSRRGTSGPGTAGPRRRRRRRRSPDRAGETRRDPPPLSRRPVKSKQGLDSRRALTGSRDLAAAEPRPAGPGQAGPNEADGGVAAAEAAGGRGSGPRSFLRQSRPPAAPEVFCAARHFR